MDTTPINSNLGRWFVERGPRRDCWRASYDWISIEVERGEGPEDVHMHVTESGTAESRFTFQQWPAILSVAQELIRRVAAHTHGHKN